MLDELKAGLKSLGVDAESQACDHYLAYIALLDKWNKTYNLTAVKDPVQMLERHVLDSLSVLSYIEGQHCIDIGTGPGLPGMILAIAQPDSKWTLLDSNHKKTRFLNHVKAELDISNVEVVHSRSETYKPEKPFDTVICRAFAPLDRILEQCQHLITDDNQLLAMKGKQVQEEINQLAKDEFSIHLHNLVYSSDANLIQIRRAE